MKIYTKTGDQGKTGLLGGGRVSKDHLRIEAYGTVDELNALLGLARTQFEQSSTPESLLTQLDKHLATIQNDLFIIGAELATIDAKALAKMKRIEPYHVEVLERAIDSLEEALSPLREFILPGGSPAAAQLHLARTVCRRAERRVIALSRMSDETVSVIVVVYLNRLSDLLFVMARLANLAVGIADVAWQKG